ncbi:Hydroxyacid oxidase 1 [Cercospora beticola]|uniref:Oxidase FUB9 n=1 Tax=Cercospora beticola TaxID=122368 RepID=A0A2G5H8Q2_CERBT|nr:Hydroxyacid oxidase 1 [Cercospora beticola]PIA88906.1 Hydroxyacid oxidase 1 [Cercospora beticola]WPB02642.1 hypothetical protein RHO25_007278 [Cercospora beticola]
MANRGERFDPHVHTICDLKRLGSAQLPQMYREYYNEGAMDLLTLKDNEAAYRRYMIKPRIFRNVANVDTSCEIFGQRVSMPLGFSPAAMHRLAHPEGELAVSRAAAKHNIAMGLSSYATEPLESVIAEGGSNPYAMQLCVLRNREISHQMIRRAEEAGYKAILVSVDTPLLGRRLNEHRNEFTLPEDMGWPNLLSDGKKELTGRSSAEDNDTDFDPTLTWETAVPWLRRQTKLQIWLKGITAAEDVRLAITHGVDGILVSNHGGRQLDGQPATLDSLRECAEAAGGKIPIAVDGGIRRGSDIFKALALGATHCFVGRIPIWGLAVSCVIK